MERKVGEKGEDKGVEGIRCDKKLEEVDYFAF